MSQAKQSMIERMHNPLWNGLFNDGVERACELLAQAGEMKPEHKEFAQMAADVIRKAKLPVEFQIDFADAIKADPTMAVADKEYWLELAADPANLVKS
jgi:hypothetical protein